MISLALVLNEIFRRYLNDKEQGEFDVNQYPPSAVVGLKNERAKNYEDLKQSIILNR